MNRAQRPCRPEPRLNSWNSGEYRMSKVQVRNRTWTFGVKKKAFLMGKAFFGAENEIRTRDLNLGKVALYQLSYFRIFREPSYRLVCFSGCKYTSVSFFCASVLKKIFKKNQSARHRKGVNCRAPNDACNRNRFPTESARGCRIVRGGTRFGLRGRSHEP